MKIFAYDLYRYYGKTKMPLLHCLVMSPELRYLRLLRSAQKSKGIWRLVYKFRIMLMQRQTHIQIPVETQIGRGFYIGHFGRIIIHPKAIIGDNVNIATGVTIGQTNRGSRKGAPIIYRDFATEGYIENIVDGL